MRHDAPSIDRRFWADRDGAGVLEFAIVIPVLIFFVVGIMEVCALLFAESLLEGGVREAARYGITGALPNADETTREQEVVNIVNEHGIGFVVVAQENVETLVYPNFEAIGQPEPYSDLNGNGTYNAGEPFTDMNCNGSWDNDMGFSGLGVGGEIVLYRVEHDYSMLTGLLDFAFTDGAIPISASVAVRNDPYGGDPTCIPVEITE